jgi:hypothetical protein
MDDRWQIFNDGPRRWVLVDNWTDDPAPAYETEEAAQAVKRNLEDQPMPDHPSSTPPVTEPTAEELARKMDVMARDRDFGRTVWPSPAFCRAVASALERLTLAEEQHARDDAAWSQVHYAQEVLLNAPQHAARDKAIDFLNAAQSKRHRAKGKPHA